MDGRICVIEGCGKPHRARGWCVKHYQRWETTGDPLGTYANGTNVCVADGCGRPSGTNALCLMHLKRQNRFGTHVKTCPRCGNTSADTEFGVDSGRPDGLTAQCVTCRRVMARTARGRQRERRPNGETYDGGPCGKCGATLRYSGGQCVACLARIARLPRTDKQRASQKARSARWVKQNPDKLAARTARRRIRKINSEGIVERVDRFRVWLLSAGRCGICGVLVDFDAMHVDHIVPLARGGKHTYANTQAAHPRCNQCKGARLI